MNFQSKFGYTGYFIITQTLNIALCFVSGTELRTDGQTNGQTDDPITRCPRRTFRSGAEKSLELTGAFFWISPQHKKLWRQFTSRLYLYRSLTGSRATILDECPVLEDFLRMTVLFNLLTEGAALCSAFPLCNRPNFKILEKPWRGYYKTYNHSPYAQLW